MSTKLKRPATPRIRSPRHGSPQSNQLSNLEVQRPGGDGDIDTLHIRLWKSCGPPGLRLTREDSDAQVAYLKSRKPHESPTVLFDGEFYLSQLPWFARNNIDPLDHYLRVGWSQGLSPHIAFDSAYVAEQCGIRIWSEPPLLRYFEHADEVSPNRLFDVDIYRRYVNVSAHHYARLFEVFLGDWRSARAPFSRLFSLYFYAKFELVTREGGVNPLVHYLATDSHRRRDPSPMVHNRWYDIRYPAYPGEPSDPLSRFAMIGLKRGDLPNPLAAQQLKLTDPTAGVARELLLEYVDVSAVDAKWFENGGMNGFRQKYDGSRAQASANQSP